MNDTRKFSELTPNEQIIVRDSLRRHEDIYINTYEAAASRIINTLIVGNGGALVAILGYFGSFSASSQFNILLKYLLFVFLLGFVFTVVAMVLDYIGCLVNLALFEKKAKEYINLGKNYKDIFVANIWQRTLLIVTFIFGILSFFTFLFGCYFAYIIFI